MIKVVLIYWDHRYNKPAIFDETAGPWTVYTEQKRLQDLEFLGSHVVTIRENSDEVLNS